MRAPIQRLRPTLKKAIYGPTEQLGERAFPQAGEIIRG